MLFEIERHTKGLHVSSAQWYGICFGNETMLDHVTVVFSYATAVVLNLKTQSVNIYSGFKG